MPIVKQFKLLWVVQEQPAPSSMGALPHSSPAFQSCFFFFLWQVPSRVLFKQFLVDCNSFSCNREITNENIG